MASSRFQAVLTAGLALALGLSIRMPLASGYPGGSSVSLGSNPVFSYGGSVSKGGSGTVLTAPSDMDMVVTDVSLGMFAPSDHYCKQVLSVQLRRDDGTVLGQYPVLMDIYRHGISSNQTVNMQSGLRVPAGESLTLAVEEGAHETCSSGRVDYALSGYYAQP